MDWYAFIKPLLFSLPAESAHQLTLKMLKKGMHWSPIQHQFQKAKDYKGSPVEIGGLNFPNPVGLAAGLDKNAEVFQEMGMLGFGMVEIGTVTPKPQTGNPKPRLFRLPKDEALINRMGFNNDGVVSIMQRLQNREKNMVIGGNIGKNKDTLNENAAQDYAICFETLWPYVDYFTINVSSPNTPGLRELQQKENLEPIFTQLREKQRQEKTYKPVFLKIAPDLQKAELDHILELVNAFSIDAVIATNTTIDRSGINLSSKQSEKIGKGGLSGKPLKKKSTAVLRYLKEASNGSLPLIASGGIMTPNDALEKLNAGASLIQLYTGLIYKGPFLVASILEAIEKQSGKA